METFKTRAKLLGMVCCLPAISFILIRWPLFFLHGMKEWPVVLCCVSLLAAAVWACLGARVPAWLSAAGYPLGFIAGQLFGRAGTDPGGGSTHSGWLVWTLVLLLALAGGVLWFVAARKLSGLKKNKVR